MKMNAVIPHEDYQCVTDLYTHIHARARARASFWQRDCVSCARDLT